MASLVGKADVFIFCDFKRLCLSLNIKPDKFKIFTRFSLLLFRSLITKNQAADGCLIFYPSRQNGGLVCNQRACALYVITASAVYGIKRASACMIRRRLDAIPPFGRITYRSSSGLYAACGGLHARLCLDFCVGFCYS